MIQLRDTLSKEKVELKSNSEPITIYSCGPTVYDTPHIGNWFAFVRWDILNRTLLECGFQTTWIMNITDVGHLVSDADEGEDKLEKGAKRENKTAWEVADYYTEYFLKGLERLNFSPITKLPKATDHIEEQINLIQKLEAKNFTYKIDDGVYFDSAKLSDYGKLAHLDIEHLKEGARVEVNPDKRNPTDFALWKIPPTDSNRDMEWDSPWGKGFPGWHIECSAMSMKYLGETIDIHTGGIDHIPVHHTNEIAQSESATGKQFVNIWLHSNFLQVDGKKISKSIGNLITLEDIEAKGFSLENLRVLILSSHYRTQSQFSWDNMSSAKARLQTFKSLSALIWQPISPLTSFGFQAWYTMLLGSAQDDLNTPELLARLGQICDELLDSDGVGQNQIEDFKSFVENIDKLTGLKLSEQSDINSQQKDLIRTRESARENKDWAKSDELRDELIKSSVGLRDTSYGQKWYRIDG